MPTPRNDLAAVFGSDGKLYAMGGFNSGGVVGSVEVYTPSTNSWSTAAPMPTPRNGLTAVLGSDGKIYASGGQYASDFTDGPSLVVEVFDPTLNMWSTAPSLPEGRYEAAAAAGADGNIYLMGGLNVSATQVRSTVYAFAPGATSWTVLASPMTSARETFGAARLSDGRIFCVGGMDQLSAILPSAEAFLPPTGGWNTLPPLGAPREYHTVAAAGDGRVYVMGGREGGSSAPGFLDTNDVFDPVNNQWSPGPRLPSGRQQMAAATGPDGKIYVVGGDTDPVSGPVNDLLVFTP